MNEYIIVNKTTLEKRIEELEEEYKSEPAYQSNTYGDKLIKEIMILKQIISQSTLLIPEIEKAYNWGYTHCEDGCEQDVNDCISNLKLDI